SRAPDPPRPRPALLPDTPLFRSWRGAGGTDVPEIFTAAASLELLQACALIHDDVIDNSDTRRGLPSTHRRIAGLHRDSGWSGARSEEHTSELQSRENLVCRLLPE